jgi:hypothetical protein
VRQFFFAVWTPHRPTDAKLTGERNGPNYISVFPSSMSFKGGLWIPITNLNSPVSAQPSLPCALKNPAARRTSRHL